MVNKLKKVKRTVNEDMLNQMKKLRKKGYSYTDISLDLKISHNTVMYHLNKEHREKIKEKNRNRKTKRKRKVYFRKYQKERYNNDWEFREKQKQRVRESARRKKNGGL